MTGSNSALLLIAAAAGYVVLERASRQKGGLKRAGQVIGWGIVLVSAIGVVCQVMCLAAGGWPCHTGMKKGWCPMVESRGGMSMMPSHPVAVPPDAREQDER